MTFWEALNSIWAKKFYLDPIRLALIFSYIIVALKYPSTTRHYKLLLYYGITTLTLSILDNVGHVFYVLNLNYLIANSRYHSVLSAISIVWGSYVLLYFQKQTTINFKKKLMSFYAIFTLNIVLGLYNLLLLSNTELSQLRYKFISLQITISEILFIPGSIVFFLQLNSFSQ